MGVRFSFTLRLIVFSMRHVAAYLLAALGGNDSPSASDIKAILSSVGVEADDASLKTVVDSLKGKVRTRLYQISICARILCYILFFQFGLVSCAVSTLYLMCLPNIFRTSRSCSRRAPRSSPRCRPVAVVPSQLLPPPAAEVAAPRPPRKKRRRSPRKSPTTTWAWVSSTRCVEMLALAL